MNLPALRRQYSRCTEPVRISRVLSEQESFAVRIGTGCLRGGVIKQEPPKRALLQSVVPVAAATSLRYPKRRVAH